METIFMMNEEIARGMVCFFHQKKHSYLILVVFGVPSADKEWHLNVFRFKLDAENISYYLKTS
jgi:hypothetical protein